MHFPGKLDAVDTWRMQVHLRIESTLTWLVLQIWCQVQCQGKSFQIGSTGRWGTSLVPHILQKSAKHLWTNNESTGPEIESRWSSWLDMVPSLFERGLHVPQRANIWLINLSTRKSRALELHWFRPELACLFLFANLLSQWSQALLVSDWQNLIEAPASAEP